MVGRNYPVHPLLNMSVAAHLGINLADYDRRIRTFIPWYEEMLAAAAEGFRVATRGRAPTVVDLGVGTGALAARCLAVKPRARLIGVDEDADILQAASHRLRWSIDVIHGSFEDVRLPRADAIVASLALHHVRTPARKRALYERCRSALRPGGVLVSADCAPSADDRVAAAQHEMWRQHMRATYSGRAVARYFAAWSREDVYLPLETELDLLAAARFEPLVVWRRGPFAVVLALK